MVRSQRVQIDMPFQPIDIHVDTCTDSEWAVTKHSELGSVRNAATYEKASQNQDIFTGSGSGNLKRFCLITRWRLKFSYTHINECLTFTIKCCSQPKSSSDGSTLSESFSLKTPSRRKMKNNENEISETPREGINNRMTAESFVSATADATANYCLIM